MQHLRRGALLVLALAHAALLWRAIRIGTMETIDSPSYLDASAHRPPLYPLFLDIVEGLIPGDLHQSLHIVQLALGGFAIWLLSRALHRRFSLDLVVTLTFAMFLALPYYRWQWLGNFVMSEGLAYPLFLISAYFLLEALAAASLRQLVCFFALAIALFLTRKQFLFVFPIGFFAAVYFALRAKSWRRFFGAAGLTCVALAFASLAALAVSWSKERQLPLTAIQLIPLPLYMLDGEIPSSLTPEERKFVTEAWSALHAAGMTRAAFEESGVLHGNIAHHYASNFSTSVQRVILPLASRQLLGQDYQREDWRDLEREFSEAEARQIDGFLLGIWRKLVLAQPLKALAMYADNVVTHIGGSMLLLFFCVVAASSTYYALLAGSRVAAFLAACTLLHFANFLFTGMFEPLYPRYGFYTENLLLVGLLSTLLWHQRHDYGDMSEVDRKVKE
jgi:hypothetical protein